MIDITYIDLEHSRRQLRHPFPLSTAGICHIDHDPLQNRCYENFELTLRFESTARFARDRINGVDYQTAFPNYVLKRSGMHHEYSLEDSRSALFFSYGRDAERLLENYGLLDIPPVGWFGSLQPVFEDIDKVTGLLKHSQESHVPDELDMTAFHILQELYFGQQKQNRGRGEDHPEKIRRIASYLENHLNREYSMEALAARFGYSERGFYRHWKEYFSISPQQYLLEKKIKRAEYLLANTGIPITEIAMQLKFSNISYFSTCFRRISGLSPREFRSRRE